MKRCMICLEGYEPTTDDDGICPRCRAVFERELKRQEMEAEFDECARQIIKEVLNG